MAEIAAIAALAGSAVSAMGTIAAGQAAMADAEFQAKQLKAKGLEEKAASQRAAAERRTETELALSRSQALSAASGAGTGGSVLESEKDIAGRGELLALDELFKGEQAKRGRRDQARAAIMTGKAARTGSFFKAGGTILSGIGSAYGNKYG